MKKINGVNLTAAAGLALGLSVAFGAAQAHPACYQLAPYEGADNATIANLDTSLPAFLRPMRLVYRMKLTGDLIPGNKKSSPFGHGRQRVYGVDGKATNVCGPLSMAMATGSAIVTKFAQPRKRPDAVLTGAIPLGNPNGARLGMTIHPSWSYRYVQGGPGRQCGSVELDCTTIQTSATPNYWTCQVQSGGALYGPFVLVESDIAKDPYCSIFQDGARKLVETR